MGALPGLSYVATTASGEVVHALLTRCHIDDAAVLRGAIRYPAVWNA